MIKSAFLTSILIFGMLLTLCKVSYSVNILHVGQSQIYHNIQDAINVAVNGDIIIVDRGTYYENIEFGGKNIILTSTNPADWDIVKTTTINGGGTNRVVNFSGTEGDYCKLTGFTITGGLSVTSGGGGIQGNGTEAKITRCMIYNNSTHESGGGIQNCNGIISQCFIIYNWANECYPLFSTSVIITPIRIN